MIEKRVFPRHRVLKAGTIEFDGGAINCMVRNMSNIGAALKPVRTLTVGSLPSSRL
jgi:hypothetical protein